jgi:hypothetical protein
MTLRDGLHELADELSGRSWESLFPDVWTAEHKAQHHCVAAAAKAGDRDASARLRAHLNRMMDEPFLVTYDDAGAMVSCIRANPGPLR